MFAHSDRIDRWLGPELAAHISALNRGFHGTKPIPIMGLPPGVGVRGDGEFVGKLDLGAESCLLQYQEDRKRKLTRHAIRRKQFGGWATDTALQAANFQRAHFQKVFGTVIATSTWSSWLVGNNPAAGAVASAAPGGVVPTTGGIPFNNSTANEFRFLSAETVCSANSSPVAFLLYDRLFAVAKTINSTATEAVTGVPTRYQSTTQGAENSSENNFLFIEVSTVLANTAHNWTACTYTDQSGNAGATLPSLAGIATCAANRLDMPINTWFCPLAAGDSGIQALTQMQCDALVATGVCDFVIGHPIAWMPHIQINAHHADERILTAPNFARLYDNCCLAILGMPSAGGNLTVTGYAEFGQ